MVNIIPMQHCHVAVLLLALSSKQHCVSAQPHRASGMAVDLVSLKRSFPPLAVIVWPTVYIFPVIQKDYSEWKLHGLTSVLSLRACLAQWLPWLYEMWRARLSPMGAISCWCSQSFPVGLRVCSWDSPEGCSTKTWWDEKFGQKGIRDTDNDSTFNSLLSIKLHVKCILQNSIQFV